MKGVIIQSEKSRFLDIRQQWNHSDPQKAYVFGDDLPRKIIEDDSCRFWSEVPDRFDPVSAAKLSVIITGDPIFFKRDIGILIPIWIPVVSLVEPEKIEFGHSTGDVGLTQIMLDLEKVYITEIVHSNSNRGNRYKIHFKRKRFL